MQFRQDFRHGLLELRPLIASIGEQLFEEREQPEQRGEQQNAAVAVLNIRGVNDDVKQ